MHWLVTITKKVSPPVVIRLPPESFAVTVTVTGVPAAMFWMPLPLTTEVVGLAAAKARCARAVRGEVRGLLEVIRTVSYVWRSEIFMSLVAVI